MKKILNLKNKIKVLITGATSGIGKAIFEKYSKDTKFTVYGLGSRKIKNKNFISVDLSNLQNIKNVEKKIKNLKIDILINCAGINSNDNFENLSLVKLQKIHNVNFYAPFLITQFVIKNMKKKKWGRIVNITSIFAEKVRSNRTSYITSKFALNALTKTVAIDYSKFNILSNSVAPGIIDTKMTKKMLKNNNKIIEKKVPLARLGKPEDVSSLVYFLASDKNKFITGQQFLIDGGYTII